MKGVGVVANYTEGVALLVGCSGGEGARAGLQFSHSEEEREKGREKSFVVPRLVDDEGELPESCGDIRSLARCDDAPMFCFVYS